MLTCSITHIDSHLSTGQCAAHLWLLVVQLWPFLSISPFFSCFISVCVSKWNTHESELLINMAKMAVIFLPRNCINGSDLRAGGDSCLSALVNSQACEGQELTHNEAWQCCRARQGSDVNSGCSTRGSIHTTEVIRPRQHWSSGLDRILTHIRAWMQNKLASVNIHSLLLTQPPKCCHVYLTSSHNNRDNSDHDGKCWAEF